jgi:NAD(P)-dependent dehydrogenase (short-subunit alcohol dehydrogenase family)
VDFDGKVAVVTGGAGGIGRGIVHALLDRGAHVVVADIEGPVLETAVAELAPLGTVRGVLTDVAYDASVTALADDVYATEGRCDLLFANAGVTSGGGGLPWEQEVNDWRWCFSVNVIGVAATVLAFLPRSSPPRPATEAWPPSPTPASTPRPRPPSAASSSR